MLHNYCFTGDNKKSTSVYTYIAKKTFAKKNGGQILSYV